MYRIAEDFVQEWANASKGALKVMQAIPNDKMEVAIVEGHNSLGWLSWHLVKVAGAFGHFAGLQIPAPGPDMEQPETMAEIVEMYEEVREAYKKEVASLTEEQLLEEVPAFGGTMKRGALLRVVITHQTHHVGQMTVLLRQAGLNVPPVMGPTKEMQ
ncbi:DinB family protein [Solibacillus daqui]|uniref:DinB family protein n=1 Tax=Solibacillus daqui TaxID=2912187 RepID=UPI002365E433|nr:DinB family protein [Solibacillus daqui]